MASVLEGLKNYIRNREIRQAVLLDGAWGTGKTYFIKNTLRAEIKLMSEEKDYTFIYISLYGISSREQLEQLIKDTIWNEQIINGDKFKKYGTKVLSLLGKAAEIGVNTSTGINVNLDFGNLVSKSDFINLDNCIFIFDDLERSGGNINDWWGVINFYAEAKGCPVIVVANETELLKDIEPNIAKKYTQEKEKSVYCTLEFTSDLDIIFDYIIYEVSAQAEIKAQLQQNKEMILDILQDKHPGNLRTLKFAINVCVDILEKIHVLEDGFDSRHNEIYERFIKYIVIRSAKFKIDPQIELNLIKDYAGLTFGGQDNDYSEMVWGFKVVDIYIGTFVLDEELLRLTLDNEIKILEDTNLSYHQLQSWSSLDEAKVVALLDLLVKEINDDRYDFSWYKQIIWCIVSIKYLTDLKYDWNKIRDVIISAIESNNNITQPALLDYHVNDNIDNEYREFIRPIKAAIINNETARQAQFYLRELLDKPNELKSFVYEHVNDYYDIGAFARFIGSDEELQKYFSEAESEDLWSFRFIIRHIYLKTAGVGKLLEGDLDRIKKIKTIIERECDSTDKIIKFNKKYLLIDLEQCIDILSNS